MPHCVCYAALWWAGTLLRCLTFCGGTSSLRIWSGWIRETFKRPLKFWLDMLVSIIILANLTALYNPSPHFVRRSMTLSPICWYNVQYFGSWESSTSKDHWLREQNKPSGVLRHWSYVSWQVERSRNSLLLLYDLDLSSQYLRLGSFALCSGSCLDNCWQLLVSRYFWGVKGTCSHPRSAGLLLAHPPSRRRSLQYTDRLW